MRARPREICDSSRLPTTASVSIERLSAIFHTDESVSLLKHLRSGVQAAAVSGGPKGAHRGPTGVLRGHVRGHRILNCSQVLFTGPGLSHSASKNM